MYFKIYDLTNRKIREIILTKIILICKRESQSKAWYSEKFFYYKGKVKLIPIFAWQQEN